jgi:hypothetical protein
LEAVSWVFFFFFFSSFSGQLWFSCVYLRRDVFRFFFNKIYLLIKKKKDQQTKNLAIYTIANKSKQTSCKYSNRTKLLNRTTKLNSCLTTCINLSQHISKKLASNPIPTHYKFWIFCSNSVGKQRLITKNQNYRPLQVLLNI